jgi:antirestriction protein ArdC
MSSKPQQNDKRAIFTAASHAQKAADYLHGLQPKEQADDMREVPPHTGAAFGHPEGLTAGLDSP